MVISRYQVIYVDPPWDYGSAGNSPKIGGGAKAHYPCMSMAELCALPVSTIAADDAVLLMWATSPFLSKIFKSRLIEAWGFEYKSSFVWNKVKHNMGHYNSVRHELLLICTRGAIGVPGFWTSGTGVYSEPRTAHSKKPGWFRSRIAETFFEARKIELFARERHEGWDAFGNEIQSDVSISPANATGAVAAD